MKPHHYVADFERLLKAGMTHAEALQNFNREDFHKAVNAELADMGATGPTPLFDLFTKAIKQETNDKDFDDAIELWLAGWTSDPGNPPRDVFSWYWRSPPIPPRKQGRKYASTNQALNALRKRNEA